MPPISRCLRTHPCSPTPTTYYFFSSNSATSADPTTYPNVPSPMSTPSSDADPPKTTPTENSSSTILNNAPTAAVSALKSPTAPPSTSQSPSAPLASSVAETSLSTITNGTSTATVPTSESSTASPSLSQSPSAPLASSVSLTSPRYVNVGAIAGGTVGGFVVLASLGLIVFLWLSRRRRHRIAPSAAYRAAYGSTPPPIYPRVQSIPPGHHTPLPQASEKFVVSSTRSTIFDGHRPSVAF